MNGQKVDFSGIFNRQKKKNMQPDAAVVPCTVFYRGVDVFWEMVKRGYTSVFFFVI